MGIEKAMTHMENIALFCLALSSSILYVNQAEHVPADLKYKIDQAKLHINSTVEFDIELYTLSENCVKCPYSYITRVSPDERVAVYVNTTHRTYMEVRRRAAVTSSNGGKGSVAGVGGVVCRLDREFGEHGVYYLFIFPNSTDDNIMCTCFYLTPPQNSDLPILYAFIFYVCLFTLIAIGKHLHRRHIFQKIMHFIRTDRLVNADLGPPPPATDSDSTTGSSAAALAESSCKGGGESSAAAPIIPTPPTPPTTGHRLTSLDTFRGLSLVIMIFVNYGAGRYWYLRHARWNGLHLADMVFPWFMFIMGTSIAIAFHKTLVVKKVAKWKVFVKVGKRTFWLFSLGIMLNSMSNNDWHTVRVPGVLQRFAACYLTVALIDLVITDTRPDRPPSRFPAPLRDIASHWIGWLITVFCVITWLAVTFLLPVPGCPAGYLGPGGLHDNMSHPQCTGGAAGYIDRWFFTRANMYNYPTCKVLYNTAMPYDPEGMLGTLTSIFLVYLGLQAGKIFVYHERVQARIGRLLTWGVICCLIAGALCGFSRDEGVIPINKNLWSLSFVLCLGGMAFILLSLMYYVIDVRHLWSGSPLYQPGMNSILLYMGSEVLHSALPFTWKVNNTHAQHLATNLFGTSLWVVIACYWHYARFYVAL